MPTEPVVFKMEDAGLARALAQAGAALDPAEGDLFLDFSQISRIESAALHALQDMARAAEEKGVKVTLCGVHPSVYKVLKLSKVAQRFAFVD